MSLCGRGHIVSRGEEEKLTDEPEERSSLPYIRIFLARAKT